MNTANSAYELQIIKKAIANHLDRTLPSDANKALYLIRHQIDDLVWNISTSIYRQSGYKVDFSLVGEIANARIESLKILELRQAEEARLRIEAEERRKAEEKAKKIEAARREEINKARKQGISWQKIKNSFFNSSEDKNEFVTEVFVKLKEIIAEQLEVESDRVTLDSSLANDLGADEYDLPNIVAEIEEEFDLELDDEWVDSIDTSEGLLDYIISNL